MEARHCQIIVGCGAAVLAGDDVIDLEGKPVVWIRNPAVLATMVGAQPNLLNQELVHGLDEAGPSDFSSRRALDCRIESRLPTCR